MSLSAKLVFALTIIHLFIAANSLLPKVPGLYLGNYDVTQTESKYGASMAVTTVL